MIYFLEEVKMKKVEEQKGPINCSEDSYRTMTHNANVQERMEQVEMRRSYQKMTLHEPKTSSKGR